MQKQQVHYRNRQTQSIVTEKIFSESQLRWFYENRLGSNIFNILFNNQLFNQLYGVFQRLPNSRNKISEFVKQYSINVDEIELSLESYRSFNAFFCRRLKPSARPFSQDRHIFCAPADGKVLVYPQLEDSTRLIVKGASITLETLLKSKTTAQIYHGGAALIIRLAPYDYHRFHFPDHGQALRPEQIKGQYHSVNPIALAKFPDIYCRNKRAVTQVHTQNFGRIAYIEVGAITVSSIVQTYTPGDVRRGQEKGYFAFGGSTIVVLFEPGTISFDDDLIRDSQHQLEVQVLAGTQLGTKGHSHQ